MVYLIALLFDYDRASFVAGEQAFLLARYFVFFKVRLVDTQPALNVDGEVVGIRF